MFNMDVVRDGNSDKRIILNEISRCLKTVFIEASTSAQNSVYLNLNSPLIQSVDRSLHHGLVNLLHGYWPLARTFCHAQTLHSIDNSVGPQGSHRLKGQAWLLSTLAEGTLLSYLQCILAEPRAVDRLYAPHAILRDPSCVTQLFSLLTGLESINILVENFVDINQASNTCSGMEENVKPVLDLPLNGGPGLSGAMTSSMTSSLASPGDSGFTQLDSETDTTSFSEIVLDADCTSVKEEIAVLPIDPCSEKTVGNTSTSEPMAVSDIANADSRLSILNSDTSNSCVDWPSADDVVYRKHKPKKGRPSDVKQQKRVSFHECSPDVQQTQVESETPAKDTLVLGHSIRSSASHLSRAVVDLSSFECEQEGVEIAKDSSILGNAGIEELSLDMPQNSSSSSRVESTDHGDMKHISLRQTYQYGFENAPVTERGTPEGQEDPPHRCSISSTVSDPSQIVSIEKLRISNSSPVPSCSSLRPQISTPQRQLNNCNTSLLASSTPNSSSVLSQAPSKACLVNRFLRSITEKKISNRRSEAASAAFKKKTLAMRKWNLYISGVTPDDELSHELLHELKKEMSDFFSESLGRSSSSSLEWKVTSLKSFFHKHLGLSSNESVLKVLKVRDTAVATNGTRVPLIAVLTDTALYVLNLKLMKHYVTFLSDLTSILVGPNSQWISLISSEKSFQINLLVGGSNCVSELIISLEMALIQKHGRTLKLPFVNHLFYQEFFAIPQWMPVLQGEEVFHYSVVHAIEEMPGLSCLSSDFDMKAYFMFKKCENNSAAFWEPGYFVLKNNTLSVSSDEESLPWHTINLQGVECRAISLESRPHVIEVGFLHIAAPDNFVAKDWLAAFQKASTNEPTVSDFKPNILSGSLVLTQSRLMLTSTLGIPKEDLDKPAKPSLTAFVSDVTSVEIGGQECCWCVVEFSCREVHESGGDYIIFFSTASEMLSFRENIRKFSLILDQGNSSVLENETLKIRCNEISAALSNGWSIEELISS